MYQLKEKERIFVFTGPDGSGRKTVADMVGNTMGLRKVVSYTTRERRPSEVDGQDYHFITREKFLELQNNREFIEVEEVNGNLYGIKGYDIEKMFKHNDFIYVVLNASGARVLKQLFGEKVIRIFIYVDRDVIIERQKLIGASEEVLKAHFNNYDQDMAYKPECRHAFENTDLAHTVFAVSQVLESYLDRQLEERD